MRRKISVILILFFALVALSSAVVPESDRFTFYVRGGLSPVLVSEKIFSLPAKNGRLHFAFGCDAAADIYRNDRGAKWGYSFSVSASYPLVSKEYSNFVSSDIASRCVFLSFGSGPVFRCTPSPYVDVSLAIRAAVLTYDYFKSGFILGTTVEGRADFFFTNEIFLSGGLSLTNGIVKYTPFSDDTWYEYGYTSLNFSAFFSFGVKLGGDRKR